MPSHSAAEDPKISALNNFVEEMAKAIREGYHFIPFLGAGFSQEAGFPTTSQLREHLLPYWIIRALELNPFAENPGELYEPALAVWNPVDAWWPSPGDEVLGLKGQGKQTPLFNLRQAQWVLAHAVFDLWRQGDGIDELHIAGDTLKQAAELICGSNWLAEQNRAWDNQRKGDAYSVDEKTMATTADWLKLIHFLSRITRRNQYEQKVHVGPPRQSVVDSLFMHLDEQCHPGLAHSMLAALTKVLRIRTVLSTNFDTLAERAFEKHRKAMQVFEVPRSTALPNNRLVLAQPSVVKLHGGKFDVRADLSVGSPLDRADFMNAVSYVAGRSLFKNGDLGSNQKHPGKAALIFMGCGDEDERTRDFAQYVARHLDNTKVFWVSLSDKDPSKVSVLGLFPSGSKHLCSYPEFGSLLLLLYQCLTGSIPPTGAIFPGPWQLISPPRIPRKEPDPFEEPRRRAEEELREQLKARLKLFCEQKPLPRVIDVIQPPIRELAKPFHVLLDDRDYSAAGICVPLFHDIIYQRNQKCRMVWIDLHDITMPAGVFTRLVMILARLQGVFDPLTSLHLESLNEDDAEYARLRQVLRQTLIRHYANTGLALVVFLNGQELPGTYGQYQLKREQDGSGNRNRWVTRPMEYQRLWDVIEEINGCEACATQFVVMAPERYDIPGHMRNFVPPAKVEQIRVQGIATGFNPEQSAERAINWVNERQSEVSERSAFLIAIICMRQSCYPSEIARILSELSSGTEFGKSEEHQMFQRITGSAGWLERLNQLRVFRFRDGGFIWMNSRVVALLQKTELWKQSGELRLSIRALLGRWYGRLLFSCLDPLAAIEGIFQNIQGVVEASKSRIQIPCSRLVCMVENAAMLLNASRRLFEVRLTTTFADRSLEVTKELVDEAVMECEKGHFQDLERERLLDCLKSIANSLQAVRDKVAIREGRFRQLAVLPDTYSFESNPDGAIQQGAAWLHLRRYEKAIDILEPAWEHTTGYNDNYWRTGNMLVTPADATADARQFAAFPPKTFHMLELLEPKSCPAKRYAVRLARWGLYLHLNSSQINWVLSEAKLRQEKGLDAVAGCMLSERLESLRNRRESLKKALWFYHFGVEVLRSFIVTDDGFVFDEGIRFRAHGALAQALLEATENGASKSVDSATCWAARRMLRDAESFLGDYPIREAGVSEAMLKLRAGEVELIEVMSVKAFDVARTIVRGIVGRSFQQFGDGKKTSEKVASAFTNEVRKCPLDAIRLPDEDWSILARRVGDALEELDLAEELLAEHPKSRWWWWILAVLKARAVEYLYTIRYIRAVCNGGGFGMAPLVIAPSAFRFVDNGLLRIVLEKDLADSFYLARVISSFTTIIRMDYNHALLRPTPDNGDRYMKAWWGIVRHRIDLNVAALEQLMARLEELLLDSESLQPKGDKGASEYARICLARAEVLVVEWRRGLTRRG